MSPSQKVSESNNKSEAPNLDSRTQSTAFGPTLRQLPMGGMAQVFLLLASAANFQANSESRAHNLYAFLIVTTGIDISIINTVSLLGPSAASILKGIANYFFPHFLPTSTASASKLDVHKTLRLHLLVAISTSLSTCLVTTYFHRREDKTMQDYVSFTIGHWVVISLNLAVLLVYSCLNLLAKQSLFSYSIMYQNTMYFKENILRLKKSQQHCHKKTLLI